MHLVVRGKRYELIRRKLNDGKIGWCDAPEASGKKIIVDSRLEYEQELEIFCHEILHAAFWDMDEEAIEETARDMARALWRIGYRKE